MTKVIQSAIIHPDASAVGYDANLFVKQNLQSRIQDSAIDMVNLQSEEDFAVMSPASFEMYLKQILAINARNKTVSHTFGYTDLSSTKIEKKYVKLLGKLTVADGLLFDRSIKPPGPLRHVSINAERGEMEFTEMI